MADLIRSTIFEGIWEGHVQGFDEMPIIRVSFRGDDMPDVSIGAVEPGLWSVQMPIPPHAICDGIQNFIVHTETGDEIGSFSIIAGEAVDHDLRTEIGLLRAELDLLKKAFRRHVIETV